ncbi:MAG: hypothetical protein RI922_764 [Bacteroidota bacterium]|jgi:hypothetical protein
MKKILLGLVVMSSFSIVAQTTMDKTLNAACDCINKKNSADVVDYDSYLALVIECASPVILKNQEELKDELNIKTRDEMEAIEEIGGKVGERLVLECPKFMEITMKVLGEDEQLMDMAIDELSDDPVPIDEGDLIEEGTVVTVAKAFPCQLTVKNNLGETLNYLWTEPIDIADEFVANPDALKGKKVNIVYYYGDIYDAQAGEYVTRKIIMELTLQ